MRYLIGIDLPQKTGVLCTETGVVLRKRQTAADVYSLLTDLAKDMPKIKKNIAIHIGMKDRTDAYFCEKTVKEIQHLMGTGVKVLCEDRMIHRIYSCFEEKEDGICLYVHPDSGAGRIRDGKLLVAGGLGAPLFGRGSTYTLAWNAISEAMAAADGTRPETALRALLEKAAGLPIEDIPEELRQETPERIARYARIAIRGREIGDSASVQFTASMLDVLCKYVYKMAEQGETVSVKITEAPYFIKPFLKENLQNALGERFSVSFSESPLLLGGVRRAGEMLGIACDAKFSRTFMETFDVVRK